MNDEKYIGLDVHQATIVVAVMDSMGKLVMESILETEAATILQFFAGLRGTLSVTFEEGTWSVWLYDLLNPHVDKPAPGFFPSGPIPSVLFLCLRASPSSGQYNSAVDEDSRSRYDMIRRTYGTRITPCVSCSSRGLPAGASRLWKNRGWFCWMAAPLSMNWRSAASHRRRGAGELGAALAGRDALDYEEVYAGKSEWRLLPSADHPQEPARCMVSGAGLTHMASARNRQAMHCKIRGSYRQHAHVAVGR